MTIITKGKYCITYKDILNSAKRISNFIPPSPVLTNPKINSFCNGSELYFKLEALQQSGSFKIRGALNAILSLLERKKEQNGPLKVITHSSGNHGAALSLASKLISSSTAQVEATVISPRNIPNAKKDLIQSNGADLILVRENCFKTRIEKTEEIMSETGAVFIHPFENELVMAGQGTTALEMMYQIGDNSDCSMRNSIRNKNHFLESELQRKIKERGTNAMDTVIIPVGGGALAASCSVILRHTFGNKIKVISITIFNL